MSWKNIDTKNMEFIVLEPEDWTPDEWVTLCKLFNVKPDKTEVIRFELESLDIFDIEDDS